MYNSPPLSPRRRGRVVDCGGLENRCTLTGTVGSNPTASANRFNDLDQNFSGFFGRVLSGIFGWCQFWCHLFLRNQCFDGLLQMTRRQVSITLRHLDRVMTQ